MANEIQCTSQAARQGFAVLMASAVVLLKHETSTFRQSHNFVSINFKFAVGDDVKEVISHAKVGSSPMSGRGATIRVLWIICVFSFFNRATAQPIFAQNSSKDAVWCKEDPFGDEKCVVVKFGVFYPKNTTKIFRNGQLPAKINCRKTPKR